MRLRTLSAELLFGTVAFAGIVACGEEEEPAPPPPSGTLGSSCDPAAPSACNAPLECTPRAAGGNACTLPAGADCNPDDDAHANGGCAEAAECVKKDGATNATCLLLEGSECDPEDDQCTNGMVCSELESGGHRCFGEVILRGQVADASDGAAVENAHVMAVDDEGVVVTDVARTDELGNYSLAVPSVRKDDGSPVSATFTLRAAAQDYQAFPSGARVALPIDVAIAMQDESSYVVQNALTEIDLIPFEAGERSMISGSIVPLDGSAERAVAGVLVVAKSSDGLASGLSDKAGNFTVFNVPAGEYELQGYAADIAIESKAVTVEDEALEGVELLQIDEPTTTVSGNVQIVNAPGGSLTSVILVVADTFDPNVARGEVPRGLRAPRSGAPNVSGDFTITGVPSGKYVVLAAYENDGLVRDPDTNIAGTDFVELEVGADGGTMAIDESFKVTEALGTVSPGADEPEAVSEKPDLVWRDDSSEDWYDLRVFDALGNEVWQKLEIPGVNGSETVSVAYEGPLDAGMYYQFRVSSWRQPGNGDAAPISTTEDLRGVFFLPAE